MDVVYNLFLTTIQLRTRNIIIQIEEEMAWNVTKISCGRWQD